MPQMGDVIANAYKRPLYFFSLQISLTFLPYHHPLNRNEALAITYINQNHYVAMVLKPGAPVPPIVNCAFWGDSVTAAEQLVKTEEDALNYLVGDYLSEVTIGLLARSRNQDRKSLKGASKQRWLYFRISHLRSLTFTIKYNIKVVTNAGGLDPLSCKLAIEDLVKDLNIEEGKVIVAAVTGDDIIDKVNVKYLTLHIFKEIPKVLIPLKPGANIVVTGRCMDSALVLGPLIYEFKWDPHDDWDLLASGSLAGHIVECEYQATGGNFTDWRKSAYSPGGGWYNMGYPIIECFKNGEFFVTKPKNTGEQMLYEILDPGAYILPDVNLDFRNVKLKQIRFCLLVQKVEHQQNLKVSRVYLDGYKMTGQIIIGGIDAWNKYWELWVREAMPKLVIPAKLYIYHDKLDALKYFGLELSPVSTNQFSFILCLIECNGSFNLEIIIWSATSMAPGITGGGAGRPHPSPCLVHFALPPPLPEIPNEIDYKIDNGLMTKVPLIRLANLAREPNYYPFLKNSLTEEAVKDYMIHLCRGIVKRYELPGCNGFNFCVD
ncbi:1936_t:CDS:10 [Dentiscutata erythropus]|uniref:1936_t:CDS:1 n=1 Tax=Dentiscutata erythropus TaxID=1348616 RepID=A0A9N9EDJ3_9GLOM|nr:1936_t:CDS:10 [Dentiscutata erythropus]